MHFVAKNRGRNMVVINQSYVFSCVHWEMLEVKLCICKLCTGLVTLRLFSSLQANLQQCNQALSVSHICALLLNLVGVHMGGGSPSY